MIWNPSTGSPLIPTPTAADAGKVPTVNADGTGYALANIGDGTWDLLTHYVFDADYPEISNVSVDVEAGKYDEFYVCGDVVLSQSRQAGVFINDVVYCVGRAYASAITSATFRIVLRRGATGIASDTYGRNMVVSYNVSEWNFGAFTAKPMEEITQIRFFAGHSTTYFADGTDFYVAPLTGSVD